MWLDISPYFIGIIGLLALHAPPHLLRVPQVSYGGPELRDVGLHHLGLALEVERSWGRRKYEV